MNFQENFMILANVFKLVFWLLIAPVIMIIVLAIIVAIVKAVKINKRKDYSIDPLQQKQFLEVYGGKDNISSVKLDMSRLSVEVKDLEKVQLEELKALGATGVLVMGNIVKASFKECSENIYNMIK